MEINKEIREGVKQMIESFQKRDPRRGCWEYITKHHPSLWKDHQAAMLEISEAYQAKDASRVLAAKDSALDTFNKMIEAWTGANEQMTLSGRVGA